MTAPMEPTAGDMTLVTLYDEGRITGMRVDHADPEILITAELIEAAAEHHLDWPFFLELRCTGRHDVPGSHCGDTIVINGSNRRVVYQLTALHRDSDARWYTARWPD